MIYKSQEYNFKDSQIVAYNSRLRLAQEKKRKQSSIGNKVIVLFGTIISVIGIACVSLRLPILMSRHKKDVQMLAAGFVFPSCYPGEAICKEIKGESFNKIDFVEDPKIPESNNEKRENPKSESTDNDQEQVHDVNEKTYKIIESQLGASGTKYNNFYLKKDTDLDVNIEHELTLRPDINIKKDGSPQVLIYHTHTTESYMKEDKGFYYESFYPRSIDNNFNVTQVGKAVAEKLRLNSIATIHDTTTHDNPSYNGSYSRSFKTIEKNLQENPSIQVTIDIHRDSLGGNDTGKIKPTFKVGNKKAAQIMIMSGCDEDGSLEFPDWEYNLRFALKLQDAAEKMYPGMTRPMYFGDVKYNMNMTHGSLLIEVGSDANTLSEAVYTGSLLGDVLSKVLSELV